MGVAARAVLAEQTRAVAHAAIERNVTRPVNQPGVDLGQVIVQSRLDRPNRVVIGRRVREPDLEFIGRLIRLDSQIVHSAGLDLARREGSKIGVLLVDAFVQIAAFVVAVDRHGAGNGLGRRMHVGDGIVVAEILAARQLARLEFFRARLARLIDTDARAHDRFDELKIHCQDFWLRALVLDPVPVVGRLARAGIVEILQLVGAAEDAQNLVVIARPERKTDGLLGRVVRLGFDDDIAVLRMVERAQLDRHAESAQGGCFRREGDDPRRQTGVARDIAGQLQTIGDSENAQPIDAANRRAVDQIYVRIEAVERLRPVGRSLGVEVAPLALEGPLGKLGTFPNYVQAAIGRQRLRIVDAHTDVEYLTLGESPALLPVAGKR